MINVTRIIIQYISGNNLCGDDARCCMARCDCNGFQKSGKCLKLGGQTTACWCTNDLKNWSTAPNTCKQRKA